MFKLLDRLEKLLFDPASATMHPMWRRMLRVLRYPYALIRDLWRGELNLRAMSLVYTSLLSIVPLIAFAFSIFKGLGVHRDLEPIIYEFFRPVGENATELTARVMDFVENFSSGILGSLGLAVLLFTVISTIQKIEESLNFVWRVEQPRSFARRVSEYLSLMVVGPILLVVILGLTASAADSAIMHRISSIEPFGTLVGMFGRISPYLVVAAAFTFLYMFIPNTRVHFLPALVGGLVAALLWVMIGAAFAAFVVYSTQLALVYSSFAILITALIWIYLAWLILLVGAQLSFYVQNPQYMRRGQQEIRVTGSLAEQLALNVMYLVGKSFRSGEPGWTTSRLAARLEVPSAILATVIRSLEGANLIIATEDERLMPGRDLSEIDLNQIVDAARRYHRGEPVLHVRGTPEAEKLTTVIELALREKLEGKTLRELVEAPAK
jgi:membrane protein